MVLVFDKLEVVENESEAVLKNRCGKILEEYASGLNDILNMRQGEGRK